MFHCFIYTSISLILTFMIFLLCFWFVNQVQNSLFFFFSPIVLFTPDVSPRTTNFSKSFKNLRHLMRSSTCYISIQLRYQDHFRFFI